MKKTVKLLQVITMLILLTVIGGTYAWVITNKSTNKYVYESGNLLIEINSNGSMVKDAKPSQNDEAIKTTTFNDEITISNTGEIDQAVSMYLIRPDKEKDKLIDSKYINVAILDGDNIIYNNVIPENETESIYEFTNFKTGDSKTYKIKYWINENATTDDIAGKSCEFKVAVKARQIVEQSDENQ